MRQVDRDVRAAAKPVREVDSRSNGLPVSTKESEGMEWKRSS